MDELEQRIRAARPVSGHRDLPLSDRAKRELAELMLTDSVHHARGRPRAPRRQRVLGGLTATAAIAAVAVIGAITGTSALVPQSAHAATPALLPITATNETAPELLNEFSQKALDASYESETESFTIQVHTWTLQTEANGEASSSIVVPEVHMLTHGVDGSLIQVVTTGRASDAAGNPVTGPDVPPEGQLVREQTYAPVEIRSAPSPDGTTTPSPGDVPVTVTMTGDTVLPDNPAAMARFFEPAGGTPTQTSAAGAIRTMNDVLFKQVLAPSQQAALLAYFAGLPDLNAAGTTVDRLGRDGVVFVAIDPVHPQYQQQLIISPQTGSILGTEVIYVGTKRSDIASPAVVHYSVWK